MSVSQLGNQETRTAGYKHFVCIDLLRPPSLYFELLLTTLLSSMDEITNSSAPVL